MLARLSANGCGSCGSGESGRRSYLSSRAARQLGLDGAWLDGEIVVRAPTALELPGAAERVRGGADSKIVYYVFDAPFLEGRDLRQLALRERKARLRKALQPGGMVRFSEDLAGSAQEILENACKLGLEGLIGKARSVYVPGRTRSWIKLKCRLTQDFVIMGYTRARGLAPGLRRARARGLRAPGKQSAGEVGTGFNDELLSDLSRTSR